MGKRALAGKFRTQFRDVSALWMEAVKAGFSPANDGWERNVADNGALSLAAKCRIASILSQLTAKEYAHELDVGEDQVRNVVERSQWSTRRPKILPQIVAHANRQRPIDKQLTDDQFVKARFSGPDAPDAFAEWLLGVPASLRVGLDIWRQREPLSLAATTKRSALLNEALDFVRAADARQVQVVYASDMSRGLTAFADTLIERIRADPELQTRPVLYLPVSALVKPHRKVDLPQLVAWLSAFFMGELLDSVPPPQSDAAMTLALDGVRRAMAAHPAIIVLNGYQDFAGVLGDLRSLVADDPVTAVLKHILHPFLGAPDEPSDIARFLQNRIVLLADGKVPWLDPFARPSHELPPPSPTGQAALVDTTTYSNPDEILQCIRDEIGSVSETTLLLYDSLISAQAALPQSSQCIIAHPTSPTIAVALVETLDCADNGALAMLIFVTLSLDGVREDVLAKLLRRWRQSVPLLDASPLKAAVPSTVTSTTVAAIAKSLPSLFLRVEGGSSARMPAAGSSESLEFDDWGQDAAAGSAMPPVYALERPEMRDHLIEILLDRLPRAHVGMLQRLMSEEALHQYTVLARYSDRNDALGIRAHRLLIQGIYHGLNSLSAPQVVLDRLRNKVPQVLPAGHGEAYLRLYSVFYRQLLEAPPHWEAARTMGAEAIKRDLLLVAMNASPRNDEPLAAIRLNERLEANLPTWLIEDKVAGASQVIEDLAGAYARAALQLNDFEGLDQLDRVIDATPEFAFLGGNFVMTKVRIDRLVLDGEFEDARTEIVEQLKRAGLDFSAILPSIRAIADDVSNQAGDRAGRIAAGRAATCAAEFLDPKPDAKQLGKWSDLLSRYAEAEALRARVEVDDPVPARALLTRAYVFFLVAEEFRRQVFVDEPLGRGHLVSAHQTRAYIRTALFLAGDFERVSGETGFSKRYLFEKSRRQSDILLRYLVRYAAERASILLVEASIALAFDPDRNRSHALLLEADQRMLWSADRPRLRMRLFQERILVLADHARRRSRGDALHPVLERSAKLFHKRLTDLADRSKSKLWIGFAHELGALVERFPAMEDSTAQVTS